jgi:hypothetical protein
VVDRPCTAAAIIFSLCLVGPTGIKAKQIPEFCEYKKFQNLCGYAALTPVGPTTQRAKMKAGRPGVGPRCDDPAAGAPAMQNRTRIHLDKSHTKAYTVLRDRSS